MLISTRRMTESLLETLDRIQQRGDVPKDVVYDLTIAATVLRHAEHIDLSAGIGMRDYGTQAVELLNAMKADFSASGTTHDSVLTILDGLIAQARDVIGSSDKGAQLSLQFIAFLERLDAGLGEIAAQSPSTTPILASYTDALLKLHNGLKLFASGANMRTQEVSSGEPLTLDNLTALVRDALSDPSALVTKVNTLTGGFGKETSLFSVSSQSLTGDLVMRRDSPIDAFGGLDCHTSDKEFPLLKAAFARGFPAPEPLWQYDATPILPGPAFTIMRRAPGNVAGDATGGQGQVPVALQRTLAQVAARLHALPRMTELSDHPTFVPSLWEKSATECTRSYLAAWYEQYRTACHLPVPAVHGLFNWILAHVPTCDQPSGLVHGDIGFHNLLFNEGALSAVLDWEFAHVGDPAEDLGYIRSVMGAQLDWPSFIAAYGEAGMPIPSEERLRFFEIWSHVRNAASSALILGHFVSGEFRDIKYGLIAYRYIPHFIAQAEALIANYHKP